MGVTYAGDVTYAGCHSFTFFSYYTLLVELKLIKVLTTGLTHHIVIKRRRGGKENNVLYTYPDMYTDFICIIFCFCILK